MNAAHVWGHWLVSFGEVPINIFASSPGFTGPLTKPKSLNGYF